MRARLSGRSVRRLPPHRTEHTRGAVTLGVIAAALALSGCAVPPPSASPTPTSSATQTTGTGGYDGLAQACTGIADDLITLRTIRGSVQVGLDRDGVEAILEELREMRSLAPVSLSGAYLSLENGIESLLSEIDASPTPTSAGAASPHPAQTTTTPTPTSTTPPSVSDLVDSATDELTAWLQTNCVDL